MDICYFNILNSLLVDLSFQRLSSISFKLLTLQNWINWIVLGVGYSILYYVHVLEELNKRRLHDLNNIKYVHDVYQQYDIQPTKMSYRPCNDWCFRPD